MPICLTFLNLTALLILLTDGARILVIPANMNSHIQSLSKLGEGLANLGHHVHIIVPGNAMLPGFGDNKNITLTTYEVDGEFPFANSQEVSETFISAASSDSLLEKNLKAYSIIKKSLINIENDCVHLLENKRVMDEIRRGGYQFAIMDALSLNCYYVIPYSLDIQYASVTFSFAAWYFRFPRLPSFTSFHGFGDEMTFTQRLTTFVLDYCVMAFFNKTTFFSKRYAPHKPPLDWIGFQERTSLWFFMEDLSIGFPKPQMPNSIAVGDILAQPANPLPKDLQQFLDGSTDGAIIVSFGSFFDHIPETIARKFCDAFSRLKSRVVWKLKDIRFCSGVDNVKLLPWIPQNDLLAHSKVRVFISHGGLYGLTQSIYHSKPVVVFPIAADQISNADAVCHKGFGICMELRNFTADELESNINRILSEPSFAEKARFASAILRDKKESPAERASPLIEHVIKYGDDHLRTGAIKLTPLQFLMFDIYLFITCTVVAICAILILLCYCGCKMCTKIFTKSVKHKSA